MNINFTNKTTTVPFCDLSNGDLFVNDDEVFIKVEPFHLLGDGLQYHAINLEDGSPVIMFADEPVTSPTEAELKICV